MPRDLSAMVFTILFGAAAFTGIFMSQGRRWFLNCRLPFILGSV